MKKLFYVVTLVFLVVALQSLHAAPKKVQVDEKGRPAGGRSGGTAIPNVKTTVATGFDCKESNDYISLSYLRALMKAADEENFGVIGIKDGEKTRVDLTSFSYMSQGCFEPQFEYGPIPDTDKKYFIRVKNLAKPQDEKHKNMTQANFLDKCLEEKEILVDGQLQWRPETFDKHIGSMSSNVEQQWFIESNDYADVYYMSPDDGDYRHDKSKMEKDLRGKVTCFNLEYFNGVSSDRIIKEEISELHKVKSLECDSFECTKEKYEMIFQAYNDMGNFGELQGVVLKIIDETLDSLKHNRKGLRIQLNEKYYDDLVSKAEEILAAEDDESQLRELTHEYGYLLDKLRNEIIDPAIEELSQRYAQRSKAKSKDEKRVFDRRIAELNDIIKYFDDDGSKLKLKQLLRRFENFGLTVAATDLAELKIRSHEYGKVNYESLQRQNVKTAERKIDRYLKIYKADLNKVEEKRLAETGEATPSKKYIRKMKDLERAKQRAYTQFQEREKTLAKACQPSFWGFGSPKNPVRCQYYLKGQQQRMQRAQSTMKRYDDQIGRQQGLVERFVAYEAQGREKKRLESGDRFYDDDNYSLLGYGDWDLYDDWGGDPYDTSWSGDDWRMRGNYGFGGSQPLPWANSGGNAGQDHMFRPQYMQGYGGQQFGGQHPQQFPEQLPGQFGFH